MTLPVNRKTDYITPDQLVNVGGKLVIGRGAPPETAEDSLLKVSPLGGGQMNNQIPVHFTNQPQMSSGTGTGDFNYFNNYEASIQQGDISTEEGDFTINNNDKYIDQISNLEGDTILNRTLGDIINIDNSNISSDSPIYNILRNMNEYITNQGDDISLKEIIDSLFGDTITQQEINDFKTWMTDKGYDNIHDVFVDLSESGMSVYSAEVLEDAPEDDLIECNIHGGPASEFVNCSIIGETSHLNEAVPRLSTGDIIYVVNFEDGGGWTCINLFQASKDCDCYTA